MSFKRHFKTFSYLRFGGCDLTVARLHVLINKAFKRRWGGEKRRWRLRTKTYSKVHCQKLLQLFKGGSGALL